MLLLEDAYPLYLCSFYPKLRGSHETCHRRSTRQWQLILGLPPEPVSMAPFSFDFLSCCFFYFKYFFVSLSLTLINILSKSPGLVLRNLSYTKSRTQTLLVVLKQTSSGPSPCSVTCTHVTSRAAYFPRQRLLPNYFLAGRWAMGLARGMGRIDKTIPCQCLVLSSLAVATLLDVFWRACVGKHC